MSEVDRGGLSVPLRNPAPNNIMCAENNIRGTSLRGRRTKEPHHFSTITFKNAATGRGNPRYHCGIKTRAQMAIEDHR